MIKIHVSSFCSVIQLMLGGCFFKALVDKGDFSCFVPLDIENCVLTIELFAKPYLYRKGKRTNQLFCC